MPNYTARRITATIIAALTLLGAYTAIKTAAPALIAWNEHLDFGGASCTMQPTEIRGEKVCK